MSSGKPVLLRGDVGVGKTSLIRELGNLTGRDEKELLTLQISRWHIMLSYQNAYDAPTTLTAHRIQLSIMVLDTVILS